MELSVQEVGCGRSTCAASLARSSSLDLVVLEYGHLKEEQRIRITSRDNLIYATLVAIGAVCGTAVQLRSTAVLLALPAVCVLLGWTSVSNDRKVTEIGRYIRLNLASKLAMRMPVDSDLFGWESAHRAGPGYRLRVSVQAAASIVTFCLPGAAAILANIDLIVRSWPVAAIVIVESVGVILLAQQVFSNWVLARWASARNS